jgi:hypothetical protein
MGASKSLIHELFPLGDMYAAGDPSNSTLWFPRPVEIDKSTVDKFLERNSNPPCLPNLKRLLRLVEFLSLFAIKYVAVAMISQTLAVTRDV